MSETSLTTVLPVPKLVMQTWKTSEVPEHWKAGYDSVAQHLGGRGWKHVLMTDQDNAAFVRRYYPWFAKTFEDLKYGIQRADAIRYCFLHKFGGLYMDLDMQIQNGEQLEQLIVEAAKKNPEAEVFVIRSANMKSSFTNSFMASKPDSEVWLRALKHIQRHPNGSWWSRGKHLQVMSSTGPTMLTKVLKRTHRNKFAILPYQHILPCSVFDMEVKCRDKDSCTRQGAVMKTLRGQSWNGSDSSFFNYCQAYGWGLVMTIVVIALLYLLFARVL